MTMKTRREKMKEDRVYIENSYNWKSHEEKTDMHVFMHRALHNLCEMPEPPATCEKGKSSILIQ